MKILSRALLKFIVDICALAALLFVPAGTIHFPAAWILIGVVSTLAIGYGIYMLYYHKQLFIMRLMDTEKNNVQIIVMGLALIVLCLLLVISSLSFRFDFLIIPTWRYFLSVALGIIGATIYIKVFKINEYLSTAIIISEEQEVVSTGVYGIVRHPMYTAVMLLFLSAIIALGSILALIVSSLFFPIVNLRIKNEEKLLSNNLKGYSEYMRNVKYRMIPHVW